jgi:A/G-specific adenine glycosylase
MDNSHFSAIVLQWFDQHGRKHLPWQQTKSAYNTWISEIMLQQTQVATVIPYYNAFIARFPTVEDLAKAPIDEVLHHWTGLGYYARARNLHKAANMIVNEFDGQFPQDPQLLEQLPGVGRSTAAAVSSIAYGTKAAILDGNVKRVLARYFAVEGWPGNTQVAKKLWEHAEALTPDRRNADYTQAMMDLGATLCTRSKPRCGDCPISEGCLGLKADRVTDFPGSKPKKEKPTKQTYMLLIKDGARFLLEKRPTAGIWGGLWSFPEVTDLRDIEVDWRINQNRLKIIEPFRHTFSHYHLEITPVVINVEDLHVDHVMEERTTLWYNSVQPSEVGLAAPVKTLIQTLSAAHKES